MITLPRRVVVLSLTRGVPLDGVGTAAAALLEPVAACLVPAASVHQRSLLQPDQRRSPPLRILT